MAKLPAQVGSLGRTLGELRPAGKVEILGAAFEARSEGPWIGAGQQVVVVRGDAFGLVVRAATAEEAAAVAAAEQQRQESQDCERQRQAWLQNRRRARHLVAGAILGATLGAACVTWLRAREGSSLGWADALFPAGGLVLGLIYVVGLQAFHTATREEISESWPECPGILGRIVLPSLGCAAGAWWGFTLGAAPGAVIGAIVGGLLLAPALTLAFIVVGNVLAG
jgi:hypothetical protein